MRIIAPRQRGAKDIAKSSDPMNPFDRAFALVKMPIVPGSMKRVPGNSKYEDRYSALFEDPKSGEELDMMGRIHNLDDNLNFHSHIRRPGDDSHAHRASLQGHNDRFAGEPYVTPSGSYVDMDFRRRGYATAMYDLIAAILAREGKPGLSPSGDRSAGSEALWRSRDIGTVGEWPVRDDLVG